MKHPDLDELSAFCDGELSPAAAAAVDGHLRGCLECRERVERWRSRLDLFSRLPEPASSEEFLLRVKRARMQPKPSFPVWPHLSPQHREWVFAGSAFLSSLLLLLSGQAINERIDAPTVASVLSAETSQMDNELYELFDISQRQ